MRAPYRPLIEETPEQAWMCHLEAENARLHDECRLVEMQRDHAHRMHALAHEEARNWLTMFLATMAMLVVTYAWPLIAAWWASW